MKTVYFKDPTKENIEAAAKIIRSGGLLAIPTETVYGLGADALNEDAVLRIFLAKGRPQDNPLIIHVPDSSWLERYCENVPPEAYALAEKFWPGPLTMILPRKPIVPLRTTGGLETVGVRCPNHPITRAVIAAADVPIAAPSGNTSGRPSPTWLSLPVDTETLTSSLQMPWDVTVRQPYSATARVLTSQTHHTCRFTLHVSLFPAPNFTPS